MSVCIYSVFVLSCVQVEALRRADPPSKESSTQQKGCRAIIIITLSARPLLGYPTITCSVTNWFFHASRIVNKLNVFNCVHVKKSTVLYIVRRCSSETTRRLGGTYRLRLQGRKVKSSKKQTEGWSELSSARRLFLLVCSLIYSSTL
jgi:hypothetical protein